MKRLIIAMMVLGTLSCTKETTEQLNEQVTPEYAIQSDSIFQVGNVYQVTSKDVGGNYTTTLEFIDSDTYYMTFRRSADYHAEWFGKWTLTGDKLRLEESGNFIMSADLTKLSDMQPGFVCERHNGKVEVYSIQ